MKASYILTFYDIAAFQRRLIKNTFLYKPIVFGIALILAFIFNLFPGLKDITAYTTISSVPLNYLVNVLLTLFVYSLLIFVVRIFARSGSISRLKRDKTLIGKREIEIQEDKLILSSDTSRIELSFKAFQRIEDYEEYYFLYTDFDLAVIFPKRVQNSNNFISLLMKKANLNVC
jgi:hypothetical protein